MMWITVYFTAILSTLGVQLSVLVNAMSVPEKASSKAETGCLDGDIRHPINASFITNDCSLQCICMTGGVASCILMEPCPKESTSKCPPGTTLQEEEEPVDSRGARCSCKRRLCVPTKVGCYRRDNGEKYKVGETFSYMNCSKTCRCNENGEISCMPLCSEIKCPRGTQSRGRGEFVVGEASGCSCEIRECVPDPRKFCRVDGRRFKPGRAFITKDCKRKCRCRKNGIPRCAPLCKFPRKTSTCGPDKREREIRDIFAGGRCSCLRKVCLRREKYNWTDRLQHLEEN